MTRTTVSRGRGGFVTSLPHAQPRRNPTGRPRRSCGEMTRAGRGEVTTRTEDRVVEQEARADETRWPRGWITQPLGRQRARGTTGVLMDQTGQRKVASGVTAVAAFGRLASRAASEDSRLNRGGTTVTTLGCLVVRATGQVGVERATAEERAGSRASPSSFTTPQTPPQQGPGRPNGPRRATTRVELRQY